MKYSKSDIKAAGISLCCDDLSSETYAQSLDVLEYWRLVHTEPLATLMAMLVEEVNSEEKPIVVSRLKRKESVIAKLNRSDCHFKLNELDDICGCRVILNNMAEVERLKTRLQQTAGYWKLKNYNQEPKPSGYRGIHVFHRLDADLYGYKQLRTETQIRTRLQHAWATAVEAYDTIEGIGLKAGNAPSAVKDYFAIVSDYLAQNECIECVDAFKLPSINCIHRVKEIEAMEDIASKLNAFLGSVNVIEFDRDIHEGYFLIKMHRESQAISFDFFDLRDAELAIEGYTNSEKGSQAEYDNLLIKASSVDDLRIAYPNYFSDISLFLSAIRRLLK